jgi:hypothetical protein
MSSLEYKIEADLSNLKNIAVCISGEPRTYNMCAESIKRHFDFPTDVNVKFFAHTWNSNSYKVSNWSADTDTKIEYEEYDIEFINRDLRNFFDFEKLEVEQKFDETTVFDNLFYSEAKANLFKRQYELEHNITFDVVVKCRFDIAFDPALPLWKKLWQSNRLHEKTVYTSSFIMVHEHYIHNIDDVYYFGSSHTMDLLQTNMFLVNRNLHSNLNSWKNSDFQYNMFHMGPGCSQYLWCQQNNIAVQDIGRDFTIYRKQNIPVNPFLYYDKIKQESAGIF